MPLKDRLKIDYYLLLVLLVPLLLFLSNHEWLFPFGNATDNWISDAYFFGYGNDPTLTQVYKATRLSWVLKGWLVHRFFSPLPAYYLLHFSIFYVCIIAFFYIVKLLFNRPVALLTTLVFATYSQFHSIISFEWDYHTHDSAANILLTLLLLLLATKQPHWKFYLFLAGTTCVSAFQSPFVMMHGLSVVFWYYFLNRHAQIARPWLASVGMFLTGVLTMTLFYGVINHVLFHGSWLYFLVGVPGHQGWPGLSAYVYQPSYWQPFKEIVLYNKGIIFPLFILLFSIIGTFFLKKPSALQHKHATWLCFIAFWLCLPIPLVLQMFGWAAINIKHWQAGMDQFVFLALAGVFAIYLPVLSEERNNKQRWQFLLIAFTILCGALIFGLYLQQIFQKLLILNIVKFLQLTLLLSMLALLWKFKQVKKYFLILTIVTFFLFFPFPFFSHRKVYEIIFLILLYFLWKTRKIEPHYLIWVVSAISLFIAVPAFWFPIWATIIYQLPVSRFTILSILCIAGFFIALIFYSSWYLHGVKKYRNVLSMSVLFATANIYTASIPVAFYTYNFKCTYFKNQYLAIVQGTRILRKFDPNFHMYLWYRNNEIVPYPTEGCQKQNLAGIYGFPVMSMTALYAAIFGTRYKYHYLPEPGHHSLLYYTLNTLPHSTRWRAAAPSMVQDSPNRPLYEFLSDNFGGYLGADSLTDFKAEKFWLHVFPAEFKLAILGHTLSEVKAAQMSLQRYGYHMVNPQLTQIKEGVVSYYIDMGVVQRHRT